MQPTTRVGPSPYLSFVVSHRFSSYFCWCCARHPFGLWLRDLWCSSSIPSFQYFYLFFLKKKKEKKKKRFICYCSNISGTIVHQLDEYTRDLDVTFSRSSDHHKRCDELVWPRELIAKHFHHVVSIPDKQQQTLYSMRQCVNLIY